MKIITGKLKNHTINPKKNINFSPISSYLREVIFDVFNSIWSWENKDIIDLFAGTGILGFEALSRGCKFVYFNDINKKNIDNINLFSKDKLENNQYSADNLPYKQFLLKLKQSKIKVDLVFIDPPFKSPEMIENAMSYLAKNHIVKYGGFAIVVSKNFVEVSDSNWIVVRNKKYGQKIFTLWKFRKEEKIILARSKSKFLLISGASGVGKSKIIAELIADQSLNLAYSVSSTTRKKREIEINQKNYFFVSLNDFQKIKNEEGFLEYAKFNNHFYGTSKEYVNNLMVQEKNVLLETELIGAEILKKKLVPIYWIYILPPRIEKLKFRLEKRKTENKNDQEHRIKKSINEIKYVLENKPFDFCIINEEIKDSVAQIKTFLLKKSFDWKVPKS